MENSIRINSNKLPIKEYNGQRVVTFKDIDAVHGRPEGTARKRFNDNKKRFTKGFDYFKVCVSDIRTHKITEVSPKAREDITLITESGYLMLAKSFTDDLAWKVQRELVNNYFRGRTPEPEQLTLETSEYHYFPKTLKGEPVITVADFVHFTGRSAHSVYKALKSNCKLGEEYFSLSGAGIAQYKRENPGVSSLQSVALILKESAVRKLLKHFKLSVDIPMIEEKKALPAVEVKPSTTNIEPKYVTTDEAIVALEVLRYVKNMSENHRQDYRSSEDERMVERCTEDISAINRAIKTVGMLVAAGF